MSAERVPVEGTFTIDAEPDEGDDHGLYAPNGELVQWLTPSDMAEFGIPVPERPIRVGDTVRWATDPEDTTCTASVLAVDDDMLGIRWHDSGHGWVPAHKMRRVES